jgi:hypothetical protein
MTDALSKVSLKYKMPIHNWLPLFLMKGNALSIPVLVLVGKRHCSIDGE